MSGGGDWGLESLSALVKATFFIVTHQRKKGDAGRIDGGPLD